MKIVFLAGINNSGPGHWQRAWYEKLGGIWVEHADWDNPRAQEWVPNLQKCLEEHPGPKVLMAHSMGCLLISRWAKDHQDPSLKGAFLVGPPDILSPRYPKVAEGFTSPFEVGLPFPTALVASRNDPYSSFDYAQELAAHWKARLLDVGNKGHINMDSRLGFWDEGFGLFLEFIRTIA